MEARRSGKGSATTWSADWPPSVVSHTGMNARPPDGHTPAGNDQPAGARGDVPLDVANPRWALPPWAGRLGGLKPRRGATPGMKNIRETTSVVALGSASE